MARVRQTLRAAGIEEEDGVAAHELAAEGSARPLHCAMPGVAASVLMLISLPTGPVENGR